MNIYLSENRYKEKDIKPKQFFENEIADFKMKTEVAFEIIVI